MEYLSQILKYCTTYGRVLLITLIPFLLQNSFQSFLVVAEKPQMGLKISIMAGITNMVLDFLFIYVFKMGVFGAAFATGISQFVGGIIPFVYFIRKNDTPLRITKAKFNKKALIQTCINGSSEMLTNVSTSLVNILYNMQLMKFAGANGVVAYGVISSFFTALNNGLVSAIISFMRTLVFQVIMILLLPSLFGINGIWCSVFVAEILALLVSTALLIKNKKKYQYA